MIRGMRVPDAGFTLVELITTAAIFAILGAMLLSMVRSGMDMWNRGEAQREEVETGVAVLQAVAEELRVAFSENDPAAGAAAVRFASELVDFDCDGDGRKETRVQRLLFVRINAEERENLALRRAGDVPLGREYFTLAKGPEEDARAAPERAGAGVDGDECFRPTGGLAEAAFMAFPVIDESGKGKMDAPLRLYRGYRAPAGGEDSFFAPGALLSVHEISRSLAPVMDGLLHLEFRFWDQETETFDPAEAAPGAPGGAGHIWDSTRGLLRADNPLDPNRFHLARGPRSFDDTSDDVFPSRALVKVVVAAGGRPEGLARLRAAVKEEDRLLPVTAVRPFEEWRFGERVVRVGSEWIRFSRVDGSGLVVAERGVWNTVPADHRAGSSVYAGRAFSAEVAIPAGREFYDAGK